MKDHKFPQVILPHMANRSEQHIRPTDNIDAKELVSTHIVYEKIQNVFSARQSFTKDEAI